MRSGSKHEIKFSGDTMQSCIDYCKKKIKRFKNISTAQIKKEIVKGY